MYTPIIQLTPQGNQPRTSPPHPEPVQVPEAITSSPHGHLTHSGHHSNDKGVAC